MNAGGSSKMLEIRIVKEIIMWKKGFPYPLPFAF